MLFRSHRIYLNELVMKKRYVGKSVVISYVNDLPPDHLMSSINYPLKKVELDENKSHLINGC